MTHPHSFYEPLGDEPKARLAPETTTETAQPSSPEIMPNASPDAPTSNGTKSPAEVTEMVEALRLAPIAAEGLHPGSEPLPPAKPFNVFVAYSAFPWWLIPLFAAVTVIMLSAALHLRGIARAKLLTLPTVET